MNNELSSGARLWQYVEALWKHGRILEKLGFLTTVFGLPSLLLGRILEIPREFVWPWVFIVLVSAGFTAYKVQRALASEAQGDPELGLQIVEHSATLQNWLNYSRDAISLTPEIALAFFAKINVLNPDHRQTTVKITVESACSEWTSAEEFSGLKVGVRHYTPSRGTTTDNPLPLGASEMVDDVQIKVNLPFRVPDIENGFEYLGKLSHLTVILKFKTADGAVFLPFECDVETIHQSVKKAIMSKIQHTDKDHHPGNLLDSLEQYWRGRRESAS